MKQLNYHHLMYFHAVAREGHLGRTAEKLNLSQSALSTQIRQLEARLGHALFDRVGRRLELTEAGRVTLEYADRISGAGAELLATLKQGQNDASPLRVGSLSTLSRNFQMRFLRPVLGHKDVPVVLRSGNMRTLLAELETLDLDVVLTTELPPSRESARFAALRIADQPVGLHGRRHFLNHDTLTGLLSEEPLILPTDSAIRTGFENLLAQMKITPRIAADVDDMAMVRLLAREGAGVAVAPAVVFADEIAAGIVGSAPFELPIQEPFFAVTLPRAFPHPALSGLLDPQNRADTRGRG